MRWLIAVNTCCANSVVFPSNVNSSGGGIGSTNQTPYLGELRLVAYDFGSDNLPAGWMECNGQSLLISQNQSLYSLLGTAYGGNGTTNFNLPDLRGRVPVGTGQGTGLTNVTRGQFGSEAATLPAHTHTITGGTTASAGSGQALINKQPSAGLLMGIVASGDDESIGTVRVFAGSYYPPGFVACDGRALSTSTYFQLFNKLGYTFGGSGSSFNVPDLRGRTPIGRGQGTGLTNRTLGQQVGAEIAAVSAGSMPAHTHTWPGGTTGSTGSASQSSYSTMQPSLVLRPALSLYGDFNNFGAAGNPLPALYEVRFFAFNTALPTDSGNELWVECDGSLHTESDLNGNYDFYNYLGLLGDTWGGDGITTTGLPDMRGRAAVSQGTGTGLTTRTLADKFGAETASALTTASLPAHTHDLPSPTVTTPTSASVTDTTATLGGNVTADGGTMVTARGVVFSVTATNSNPQIGGTGVISVVGTGTTGVFTINASSLAPNTAYSYAAWATNINGTGYSSVGTFTTLAPLNTAPAITAESGLTRTEGASGSSSPIATVSDHEDQAGSLTIQVNNTTVTGATTVTVNGVTISNVVNSSGNVTASIVAACGATSAIFTLKVTDSASTSSTAALSVTVSAADAPVISTQPVSQSVAAGQNVTFTAAATGSTSVQWQVSTDNGANFSNVSGATAVTLSFTATSAHHQNQYRAVFARCGTLTTTDAAPLTVSGGTVGAIISEFRFRGSGGLIPANASSDEYIEIGNRSDSPITISSSDGSAGWSVAALDATNNPVLLFTIPNGTVIPRVGHFLGVNSAGYSLANYGGINAAAGDAAWSADIPDGSGLALFTTATPASFSALTRLDAVGFSGVSNSLFREGAGLSPAGGITTAGEYAFVRRLSSVTGFAQDSENNQNDFYFVAVSPISYNGLTAIFGSPGPENLAGPLNYDPITGRAEYFEITLLDPSKAASAQPNQVSSTAAADKDAVNGPIGSIYIQRSYTNRTGKTITRMRLRITDLTTDNRGAVVTPQGVHRIITSIDTTATVGASTLTVKGTTLEAVSAAQMAGGINSTVEVPLPGGGLSANQTIHLRLRLGVNVKGQFLVKWTVEAVTQQMENQNE
ncbi:MAG: tail fiber protein [Blastocatellia bacterium]